MAFGFPTGRNKFGQPNTPRREYVTSLDISDPPLGAIESGETYQLNAVATYNTGRIQQNAPAAYTRTAGVDGTATVSASGLITAVAPGSITVQASFGKVATQVITVEDAPAYVADVYFALPGDPLTELTGPRILDIGVEETLILVSIDQFGRVMDPSGRTYTFTSNDDTEVEVVSSSGRSVTIGGVDDDGATITGTDTTDTPDVAATMAYTVPASANVPDYVLVIPGSITMSVTGADVQLVAATYTSADVQILGDVHTFAVQSGTGFTVTSGGLVEATGTGAGLLRVRSGIDSNTYLDISVTVTAAVGGGELANHTGRTPIFFPATRLYELDQCKQLWASNPTSSLGARFYGAIKRQANLPFNIYGNDFGLMCAFMYNLRTPDDTDPMTAEAYAQKGITALFHYNNLGRFSHTPPKIQGETWYYNGYYATRYFVTADLLYQGMTQAQRDELGVYIDRIYHHIIRTYGGEGLVGTAGDSDGLCLPYVTMAMMHYFNIPENTHYLNCLNQTVVGGLAFGGVDATGSNFSTVRNAVSYFGAVFGNGGEHPAGTAYNIHDMCTILAAMTAIRHAANPTFLPEWATFANEHAYFNMHGFTHDFALFDQWGDLGKEQHILSSQEAMMHVGNMSAAAGMANGQWGQKACLSVIASLESQYANYFAGGTDGFKSDLAYYLFHPLRTAEASAYPWEAGGIGQATAPGAGRKRLRRGNTTVALLAAEKPVEIHHNRYTATDYRMNIAGKWAIDHPQGSGGAQDTGAVSTQFSNTVILQGLGTHQKHGHATWYTELDYVREEGGSAGSVLWESVTGRTIGSGHLNDAYVSASATTAALITKFEHHHIYVYDPVSGWDAVIVCYDLIIADPKAAVTYPYPAGWSAAKQALINAAQLRTGSSYPKEVQMFSPIVPTIGSDLVTWTVPGGPDVRVKILSPTSATIVDYPANTFGGNLGNPPHPETTGTNRVIRWWGGTSAAQVMTHVVFAGTGAPPSDPTLVGADPKIISFAGKTFTIGASSITVS
jgi:hypothetical protein